MVMNIYKSQDILYILNDALSVNIFKTGEIFSFPLNIVLWKCSDEMLFTFSGVTSIFSCLFLIPIFLPKY